MSELTLHPDMQAQMWKPGQSGNPKGNKGWSTRSLKVRAIEALESDCINIKELTEQFHGKEAALAILEAMIVKAIRTKDVPAAKLLFEMCDGKPTQQVNVAAVVAHIESPVMERFNEMMDRLGKKNDT